MNIKKEHISVEGLRINSEIIAILDKYKIVTYKDLENNIKADNYEVKTNYFLSQAYSDFKSFINNQRTISIDEQNALEKNTFNGVKLELSDIDKQVKAIDLPCFVASRGLFTGVFEARGIIKEIENYEYVRNHPNRIHWVKTVNENTYLSNKKYLQSLFNNKTILELKEKVAKVDRNYKGNIVPEIISNGRTGIGEQKYNVILASLAFYDRYIESLLENYSEIENPFYYKQKEKKEMVQAFEDEIFDFLINNGVEFIFGNIKKCIEALEKGLYLRRRDKKLDLVETTIANYVTYEEALDITNPKVLSKFIVPYGKK